MFVMRIFSLYLHMPRQKLQRRILGPPGFKSYRPQGIASAGVPPVELLFEEYEAIKLADYELLNHQEASVHMGVSRATFARIYEAARRKIARALVESRSIKPVCGHARSASSWYRCSRCQARYSVPVPATGTCCPICNSDSIKLITQAT